MFKLTTVRPSYKVASMLGLLFALVLNLNMISNAFASSGFVNPSFDKSSNPDINGCSLDGWTYRGDVSVVDGGREGLAYADQCVAKVNQTQDGASTLEQTVGVPADSPYLFFYLWGKYGTMGKTPTDAYLSQNISLYDSSDRLIFSKSRNVNRPDTLGYFKYDLTAYANQSVRVVITVSIDGHSTGSPVWSTLYVDQFQFATYSLKPGDSTYGW